MIGMSLIKIKIFFVLFLSIVGLARAFTAYWNVPSQQCLRAHGLDLTKLLSAYGVVVNDGDNFQGNRVTIFYDTQLGLYPKILKNGTFINGGLPQAGNLSRHLESAAKDIQKMIPNINFDGVGVIDWESWMPVWRFNFDSLRIYQHESKNLAKRNNPSLDDKKIEELAKKQFEEAAKSYMLETLLLAKKLRPLATWGYYQFPDCYNHVGKKPSDFECSKDLKAGNDELSWLWKLSTAIHPSIYLYEGHLDRYTMDERSWRDNEKLKEAMRVAPVDSKVLPYVNHYLGKRVVPQEEFRRMVAEIASVGADGLLVWGSSSSVGSRALCNELRDYIVQTLGPAIERVSWNSNICSKSVCNGNGLCTWPNDTSATAWKLFLNDSPSFYAGDIACRCNSKYSGRFCEKI